MSYTPLAHGFDVGGALGVGLGSLAPWVGSLIVGVRALRAGGRTASDVRLAAYFAVFAGAVPCLAPALMMRVVIGGVDDLFAAAFCGGILGIGPLVIGCSALLRGRHGKGSIEPRCEGCGYNLTGNLSGICPECGLRRAPRGDY